MEIVLATHNLHKLRELRQMLKPLTHLDVLSLKNFPECTLPPEEGSSFLENASIKALATAKELNMWCLADDSGLIVPALNNRPGILSKRYAHDFATDKENRQKLLYDMKNLEGFERSAHFECCLVLASPQKIEKTACGLCEGSIIKKEKGRGGFSYDSLFLKLDYDKTFAELDESTKNLVSHRRKALEKIWTFLETLNRCTII